MKQVEAAIQNSVGLHARPAALFVQTAQKYKSEIKVSYNNKMVNGKSLLGILSLAVTKGAKISIHIDGEDEDIALGNLTTLIANDFNEQ